MEQAGPRFIAVLPISKDSLDSTPASRTMVHYYAVQGSVDRIGGLASKEDIKAADDDFNRRAHELLRTGKRIADFVENTLSGESGEKILEAAFRDAKNEGVDFSGIESGDARALSPANLKKLARVLEEKYGMPPDLDAFV